MQIQELYSLFLQHTSIQTDTRKLQTGDIYVALKGDNFNGNHFAREALDADAAYVIIDEPVNFKDDRLIVASDGLDTLQQLAKYHRQQFNIPFIAITGSNGKTTTKELVKEVLSTTYKTYTTLGNLNNHIGVPLTILSIKKDAEIAVIEMGANHQKEIESYCQYTMPTHGIITNCGKAHLEGFGGFEGVKKGKGELFAYLKNTGGTAFVMNDYDYLNEMSALLSTVKTYGTTDAEIIGESINNTQFLQVNITKGMNVASIKTNLVGEYNLPNVLAAIAIGKYFNVPDESIKSALGNYVPSNSRSQLMTIGTNKIILDAYNANPSSMKAAIENFAKMEGNEKVLLLGAMMELGEESLFEHREIIDLIDKYMWKAVVLVGGDFAKLKHSFLQLNDSGQAKNWLKEQNFTNVQMLIKGSRSMQMEVIIS